MKVIKAPAKIEKLPLGDNVVFLSGGAGNWRDKVIKALKDKEGTILNPWRSDWDASWMESKDNEQFNEQVMWELHGMESASHIVIYFSPDTKAPITLLELGLFVNSNIYVCCLEGFWKKGNVDIVVREYAMNRTVYEDLDTLLIALREDL